MLTFCDLVSEIDILRLMSFTVTSHSCRGCICRWEVYWNLDGIVITQIATLDTLSSHILSLTSTVIINHEYPPDEAMQQIYLKSPGRKSTSSNTPNKTVQRAESGNFGSNYTPLALQGVMTAPRVSHTQLVVASTNLGTPPFRLACLMLCRGQSRCMKFFLSCILCKCVICCATLCVPRI